MPEGPAVAGRRALGGGADLVDRAKLAVELELRIDPRPRDVDIALLALDADPVAAEPARHRAGGAGAEKGIEHDIALVGAGEQHPVEQRLGLLGRMRLDAVRLGALAAGA